ncbi:MAG: MarR family transcriptional regulator [Sphingobacteriales bacterium]|nr:MAG: MarR family transcriptional regulator [Sphingobacteriales bacterium]
MKLEREIQQKSFRNEWQKSLVNIIFTNSWISSQIKEHLAPFGITSQQYNVLRILKGQFPKAITTSVIRERMLDKMSDVSRMVDRLLQKELVIRSTCETDRRLVDLVISQKGIDLLAEIEKHNEDIDKIVVNLSEEEARQLNFLLDKIRD